MCGFVGVFEIGRNGENLRAQVLRMSGKIRHRGPDWSGIYCGPRAVLSHERLSIVDPQSGGQPLYSPDGRLVLAVNGEIYNHRELRRELAGEYDFRTGSDCEVILPLYRKYGAGLLDRLNGIFAFALYDIERDEYLIARDPVGVIPLYIGWDADERCYVASELKALEGVCNVIRPFEPGHYRWSREGKTTRWYTRDWFDYEAVEQGDADPAALRSALEAAVRRQLMSDVPYGVLLSGGLDSSIISAVAKRFADRRIETEGRDGAWWPCLHSFAVGLKGAPDLRAARKVADHIGTVHHEIHYTVQEGLDALRDVIYHIETYDVTTVRASTPMYLLARVIKSMGVKMVLSGEGADEIFGGYPWFHRPEMLGADTFPWCWDLSPRKEVFSRELWRGLEVEDYIQSQYRRWVDVTPRLEGETGEEARRREVGWLNLNWFMATLLERKDRMSMYSGLEVRVPFCDHHLVEYVWNIPWEMKSRDGERKRVLRDAARGLLPEDVRLRPKSLYPKTHHPLYERLVRQRLTAILDDPASPLHAVVDERALREGLIQNGGDYGKPWFGQLMAGPQMMAYLVQLNTWMERYSLTP